MSSFAGDSIDKVKSCILKRHQILKTIISDTNLEVLQGNLPSPSHQKDDGDRYLLDSQNYRIVTSFR